VFPAQTKCSQVLRLNKFSDGPQHSCSVLRRQCALQQRACAQNQASRNSSPESAVPTEMKVEGGKLAPEPPFHVPGQGWR